MATPLTAITVTLTSDDETREVVVDPAQEVYEAVTAAFGSKPQLLDEALFGENAVQPGVSFEQCGIEASFFF